MLQVISHLWGDYILQNSWMANNKTKPTRMGYLACAVHVLFYCIPFTFIASWTAVAMIGGTHFLIDKYRLAAWLPRLVNRTKTDTGLPEGTPPFLAIWLLIIIDNTLHITINYFSIKYL